MKAQEFTSHIGELAALKAQHDARLAELPKDAAGYAIAPPEGFKVPDGWAIDDNHPLAAPVRALAHKHQLPQAAVSDLVQAYGEMQIADTNRYNELVAAETAKLGANATARVSAVKTWLTGVLGADAAANLLGDDKRAGLLIYSADAIGYLEKLQLAMTNQGGSTYSNGGREPPAPPPRKPEEVLYPQQARKAS